MFDIAVACVPKTDPKYSNFSWCENKNVFLPQMLEVSLKLIIKNENLAVKFDYSHCYTLIFQMLFSVLTWSAQNSEIEDKIIPILQIKG